MIPIIIGGSLAAAGIVTLIIGCKKIRINHLIKEQNKELEKENERLIKEKIHLSVKEKNLFINFKN